MANYDDDGGYCGDIDNTRTPALPANASPAEVQQHDLTLERERQADVLYLSLLCQSGGVVTEVTMPITGNQITNEYTAIFKNTTNNPVRVQAFADLVTPGCGAILSLTSDKGDQGKFDALALVANGRTESVSVIVLPGFAVWARNFNNAFFPMLVTDTLRMRVFDPMKLISYANLFR